ncbi:trace amine-associated receptor 4-like [Anableps anableps]
MTSYALNVVAVSLSLLIICGNLLVIISVIYFKQLHTPTNYLILSLAVTDLLLGGLVLPFSTILSLGSCWYSRYSLCKIRDMFDILLCTSSILNLCCISIDRYYAVCRPLIYRSKINACVTVTMILLSWTLSALLAISITILMVAKRQARKIQNTIKSEAVLSKMEKKANITLAIVMGVFLICWTPYFLSIGLYSGLDGLLQ